MEQVYFFLVGGLMLGGVTLGIPVLKGSWWQTLRQLLNQSPAKAGVGALVFAAAFLDLFLPLPPQPAVWGDLIVCLWGMGLGLGLLWEGFGQVWTWDWPTQLGVRAAIAWTSLGLSVWLLVAPWVWIL